MEACLEFLAVYGAEIREASVRLSSHQAGVHGFTDLVSMLSCRIAFLFLFQAFVPVLYGCFTFDDMPTSWTTSN